MTVSLSDGQIVVCGTGFYTPGQTSAYLENMLFADVGLPLQLYLAYVQAQNVTFTAGGYALVGPAGSGPNYNVTLNLVNCILANFYAICTIPGFTIPTGDHNGFYPAYSPVVGNPYFTCSSNPFQTAGGGNYYLNNIANGGAQFKGVGSTAIDSTLLTAIKTKTTRPPDISNIGHTISSDNFTTLVARDSASPGPDLGYHYDPLDYIFQNSTVSSTKMTFPAGAAVGWQGQGLTLTSYYPVNFNGTVVSNDYFVRCNTVQESDQSADGIGIAGASQYSPEYAPNVNGTFTRFSALGDFAAFFDANHWYVNFCNCEFWDGVLGETGGAIGLNLVGTNCLFDRSTIILPAPPPPQYYNNTDFFCQDCTLHGGSLAFNNTPPSNINADAETTNSAFDGTIITVNGSSQAISGGYNAYILGSAGGYLPGSNPNPNPHHDVFVTSSFNWQRASRGSFYLPTGSALIDKGSLPATQVNVAMDSATGAQLPLSTFTTQTSQTPDSGQVDIGYHYPLRSAGPNVLIIGNGGTGPIYIYNFANGALIYSFLPDGASEGNGRGIAIYGGNIFYTEENDLDYTDPIHVCPFVTSGPSPHDLPNSPPQQTSPLPSPAPGAGISGLAFAVDPAKGKIELFVLTGYQIHPPSPMTVYEIDPANGNKVTGGTVPQAGISVTTPGSPDSDGFAVLPDGNFLINDGDGFNGNQVYREYYSSGANVGQVRSPSQGGIQADLSSFGFSNETGVTVSPDGKSLYFITGIAGAYQTLVQTDLSGNLLGAQPININTIEGITAVPQ